MKFGYIFKRPLGEFMETHNSICTPYCQFFFKANGGTSYAKCLLDLLNQFINKFTDNIQCIILLGGLVREGKPVFGWSDIDIIVIFKDILKRNPLDVSLITRGLEGQYGIRIDLTQIDLFEINNISTCYNGELLNALALRPDVSEIVYGEMPHNINIIQEQEIQAAIFYIDNTLYRLRRYFIECVYAGDSRKYYDEYIARIIRWVFSVIRASLRIFNIYVHPYEQSLVQIETFFPDMDLTIPYKLLCFRNKEGSVALDLNFFMEIENFIYNYVRTMQRLRSLDYEKDKH